MSLGTLLLDLVKPALARGLLSLGVGVVTVSGVDSVFESFRSSIVSSLSGAPLSALQLMGLAGVWDAMGIILGAAGASISYLMITKSLKIGAQ
jgi:Protein of unknown function (DUF2523)